MKITNFLKILVLSSFALLMFYLFLVPGRLWMPFSTDLPAFLTDIPIWTLIAQSGLLILGGLAITVGYYFLKELF